MAKQAVALRLTPEVLSQVDAYAAARGKSRQVVLETFVLSGLDDTSRGVVDLVEPEPVAKATPKPAAEDPDSWSSIMWARQQRLNGRAS